MPFLGIDLGTGGNRSVVVDEKGRILDQNQKKLEKINLSMQEGESEQDPLEWIDILEDCLDELFARKSNRSVKAIAVDGTSGTILPVNSLGLPVGKALMHNDMRSVLEANECKDIFNGLCSPTFALPKILWMRKYLNLDDDVLFLHSSDFIYSWLAGTTEIPTDFTNAMKTGVDLNRIEWSEHLSLSGFRLPPVLHPGEVFGRLHSRLIDKWGLDKNVELVTGATDSNAAFYASGASQPGDWSSTIGTTLAVKGLSVKQIEDKNGRIYCHKHPDGSWLPGGASNAGGEIIREQFSSREEVIETNLESSKVKVEGLVYPSTRVGERLPFANPDFRPFNTIKNPNENNFYLACSEGIAFTEKMVFELLNDLGAKTSGNLFAMGGTTKSCVGMQIRADIHQKTIKVPAHPNSAFGSAILAASGHFGESVSSLSSQMVEIFKEVEPIAGFTGEYCEKYQQFRELCLQDN